MRCADAVRCLVAWRGATGACAASAATRPDGHQAGANPPGDNRGSGIRAPRDKKVRDQYIRAAIVGSAHGARQGLPPRRVRHVGRACAVHAAAARYNAVS